MQLTDRQRRWTQKNKKKILRVNFTVQKHPFLIFLKIFRIGDFEAQISSQKQRLEKQGQY